MKDSRLQNLVQSNQKHLEDYALVDQVNLKKLYEG